MKIDVKIVRTPVATLDESDLKTLLVCLDYCAHRLANHANCGIKGFLSLTRLNEFRKAIRDAVAPVLNRAQAEARVRAHCAAPDPTLEMVADALERAGYSVGTQMKVGLAWILPWYPDERQVITWVPSKNLSGQDWNTVRLAAELLGERSAANPQA